jgi:hypothetical protein
MIAEYIIDAYSGGGLKGKFEALQVSNINTKQIKLDNVIF